MTISAPVGREEEVEDVSDIRASILGAYKRTPIPLVNVNLAQKASPATGQARASMNGTRQEDRI